MPRQSPGEADRGCGAGDAPGTAQHPPASPQPPGTRPRSVSPGPRVPRPPPRRGADRAAIDARSRLTCSRRAEGAPTMGCLCALAGAEPAAPLLKYKQPRRHLAARPRCPGGNAPAPPDRSGGNTPTPAHVRSPGRFLPSPPAHPGLLRVQAWRMLQWGPPCQCRCPSFGATTPVMLQ